MMNELKNENQEININESKANKFKRLAEDRVPKALKRIQMVTSLANRSAYEYNPEQVGKIVAAFEKEIEDLKVKFRLNTPDKKVEFSLDN